MPRKNAHTHIFETFHEGWDHDARLRATLKHFREWKRRRTENVTGPSSTATTGRRLLVEWANDQDHWVRALVAEVLSSRRPLTAEAIEHFYDLLLRISGVENVNALATGQEIDFNPGLTVLLNEKAYEDLRGACEIVVEQDILQRVVQSYTPNVMVAKLTDIRISELPGAIEKVTEVHDRCCRFIGSHKQPLETLNVRPTLEKLEEDWRTIQGVHGSLAR
jgi:hypothetical protein